MHDPHRCGDPYAFVDQFPGPRRLFQVDTAVAAVPAHRAMWLEQAGAEGRFGPFWHLAVPPSQMSD